MKTHPRLNVVLSVALTAVAGIATGQTSMLDDFEDSEIRIVNPGESEPQIRFLWNQYQSDFYAGPDPGLATTSTAESYSGSRSLRVNVTGGNVYMQFYPATSAWNFMHEYMQGPWQRNTYDAIRFWVKIPPQMQKAGNGRENVQLGTYVREEFGDRGVQGRHYYHHYDFKHTGEWEQVIFDSHPTYVLGGSGNSELGNVAYPYGGNWTYMDALTRFYFDGQNGLNGTPATFYFDRFELFKRPANENIEQVYSLHGVYVPSTNEVSVGWARRKNEDSLAYDIRYAFEDIHRMGWDAATDAPGGTVPGNGQGGYNMMEYSTKNININGHDEIYIAIKPRNSNQFRQIVLPVGERAATLNPPTNLTVL